MRTAAIVGILLLAAARAPGARAAGAELGLFAGATLPGYSQSFSYDPGPIRLPIPGASVEQSGSFRLQGRGGLAAGAALSVGLKGPLALEARLDTADLNIRTQTPGFTARVALPFPLPALTGRLQLDGGTVNLRRATPVSLNLKLRSTSGFSLFASGGVSFLPDLEATVSQPIGLGVVGLSGGQLQLGSIGVRASAPGGETGSAIGFNVGAGIALRLGGSTALLAEGRVFAFPERELQWSRDPASRPSPLEQALLAEVLERLEPVRFRPVFFQVVAGIAVRF